MEDHTFFIFIIRKSFIKLSTFRLGDFPRVIQVLEKMSSIDNLFATTFFYFDKKWKIPRQFPGLINGQTDTFFFPTNGNAVLWLLNLVIGV